MRRAAGSTVRRARRALRDVFRDTIHITIDSFPTSSAPVFDSLQEKIQVVERTGVKAAKFGRYIDLLGRTYKFTDEVTAQLRQLDGAIQERSGSDNMASTDLSWEEGGVVRFARFLAEYHAETGKVDVLVAVYEAEVRGLRRMMRSVLTHERTSGLTGFSTTTQLAVDYAHRPSQQEASAWMKQLTLRAMCAMRRELA